MQVSYRLTEKDWLEALRRVGRTFVGMKILGAAFVVIFFGGAAMSAFGMLPGGASWTGMLLPGVLGLFFIFLDRWSVHSFCKKNPRALGQFETTIEEAGLEVASEHSRTHSDWQAYLRWEESKNLFLLFPSSNTVVPLPKCAFDSAQTSAMQDLLASKLGPGRKANSRGIVLKTLIFWLLIVISGVLLWQVVRAGH